MRAILLLCFLLALPPLAAIGHDLYMAYGVEDAEGVFEFSDLGWIWVNYGAETYNWAQQNLDNVMWGAFIDPVLRQTALIVTLVPALILYTVLGLFKVLGIWPFSGAGIRFGRKKTDGKFQFKEGSQKGTQTKYKRK